jgi:hypothetical protein
MNYRLRSTDDGLLVLQVGEYENSSYSYNKGIQWRDAKVTDIPVYDLFQPPAPDVRSACESPSYGGIKYYAETATCGNGSIG